MKISDNSKDIRYTIENLTLDEFNLIRSLIGLCTPVDKVDVYGMWSTMRRQIGDTVEPYTAYNSQGRELGSITLKKGE